MRTALFILIFLQVLQCRTAAQDISSEEFFENRIRPVLAGTCFRCHGGERVSGGLRVDSVDALLAGGDSGPAIIRGDSAGSLLFRAIARQPDVSAMPPAVDQSLSAEQVEDFRNWILAGAVWPERVADFESAKHWAFQPIGSSVGPTADSGWCRTEIDAYVLRGLRNAGLEPSGDADRRTLLRRVTFDLTGLPPTPDELDAFERDADPAAFEKVVDRLLATPAYGERWGRHWLDVVRYADTAGETADYPVPEAWRYRNYVIEAFNRDVPFDQFVREQLAGDILALRSPDERFAERVTATGYLALSRRFGFDSENYHHLTIHDTIDSVGQTFLGLSIGCARCHDHKFDPISTAEYYSLYGIFDSSRYPFPGSEQKQRVRSLAPLVPPQQAETEWRSYVRRTADLSRELAALKRPVPVAVLRSLMDLDGDFELQAPAAGGSYGVPVSPWLYTGVVSVTGEAQSPFQHVYPGGRHGLTVPSGAEPWRVWQGLKTASAEPASKLWFSVDFRVRDGASPEQGGHRIRLASSVSGRGIDVLLSQGGVLLQSGEKSVKAGEYRAGEWLSLQLELDLRAHHVVCRLGTEQGMLQSEDWWAGQEFSPDLLILCADSDRSQVRPGLDFDNIVLQSVPVGAVSREWSVSAGESAEALAAQLRQLTGVDGDLEQQAGDAGLTAPWNAGPGSIVKLRPESQSPLENVYGMGRQGLFLPQRSQYDGFGVTITDLPADPAGLVHLAFDIRPYQAAEGCGSWRYYIGHGPGPLPAVELHFTDRAMFTKSATGYVRVGELSAGEWHQVQIVLDTRNRSYRGQIVGAGLTAEFHGECLPNWDGVIDYSFIDSYGHLPGLRPALDVDNFALQSAPIPAIDYRVSRQDAAVRRGEVQRLRQQISALQGRADVLQQELQTLLANGPYPMAYAMSEGTAHDVRIQQRGEPDQLGESVARGFLKAVGGDVAGVELTGSGRLQLAEWLVRPENPLTARVIVNRVWQYHFGSGLVRTPNDFGVRGAAPVDPELLDYLAERFVREGWRIKSLHRVILRSAVWQQQASAAGVVSAAPGVVRRRLSAEEIRDSILAVSGQLDRSVGTAHPFPQPFEWGFSQHGPFSAVYDHRRRSVYLMTSRLRRHPFLGLFDGPDTNASTAERARTTVPTQALFFMNDPLVHEAAAAWSERLEVTASEDSERLRLAWRQALQRWPEAEELSEALEFMQDYGVRFAESDGRRKSLEAVLRSLLGSNEFLHVD